MYVRSCLRVQRYGLCVQCASNHLKFCYSLALFVGSLLILLSDMAKNECFVQVAIKKRPNRLETIYWSDWGRIELFTCTLHVANAFSKVAH